VKARIGLTTKVRAIERAFFLGGVELSLFSDRVANCVQDINQFAR
jgi:hypothetical protein